MFTSKYSIYFFQDDERFWAKIPVIREKKKRGGSQKETPSSGAPIKKKK